VVAQASSSSIIETLSAVAKYSEDEVVDADWFSMHDARPATNMFVAGGGHTDFAVLGTITRSETES
jgi:NADH pyrophosphatase NudC (nudix superfamily)